jgi:hypothetical protein
VLTILRTRFGFQAAIEGTAIGLTLGLIDAHSTYGDWFLTLFAYWLAGFVLGLRHAGRPWQAWVPLGLSLYFVHLAAIACGYRPPYVEEDAEKAIACVLAVWPAGLGLAGGALGRVGNSKSSQLARPGQGAASGDRPGMGEAGIAGHSYPGRAPSGLPGATSTERTSRQRLTVWRLMVIVAVVGIHLAFLRLILMSDPFFGFGTVYSERFSEGRFNTIRVGMTGEEVEALVGPPLGKVPWSSPPNPQDTEMWFYSKRPNDTSNYWRRWVVFEKGKVVTVTSDFWFD